MLPIERKNAILARLVADGIASQEALVDTKASFDQKRNNGEYEVHGYSDYKTMFEMEDLDGVYIATTWITHIHIAIDAMKAGLHVGLEVGGAASIQECFDLVRTSEETGKFCMLMENCCYGKAELMATNMARLGVFGKISHCSGGYMHDLRSEIYSGHDGSHYRFRNYLHRNCENYPTHELGPIAQILDINRGNRMVSLVSMASKSAGLEQYIKDHPEKVEKDPTLEGRRFKQGDIVNTIITCVGGETILLRLDTTLPRPYYSREFGIRGTKGFALKDTNLLNWHNPDDIVAQLSQSRQLSLSRSKCTFRRKLTGIQLIN